MEFFNRKEEVIDIQLTQYGKHLLSKGQFNPQYYAFYDDDILYDIRYAQATGELQKETEDRIKSTPRIKTQAVFSGRDLKANKIDTGTCKDQMANCGKLQVSKEKHYGLGIPLGTSDLNTSKMPAWSVNALVGKISGSSYYQKSEKESVDLTFLSDSTSNYLNTSTNKTVYADLSSVSGKTYRFYFYTLSNLTQPESPASVTLKPVAITGLTTKESIASTFKTVVNTVKENGQKVFTSKLGSNVVSITNNRYGAVKNATVSGLASVVTLSQTAQGDSGVPRYLTIPQLDINIDAVVRIGSTQELGDAGDTVSPSPLSLTEPMYPDGSYLTANFEYLVLEIEEFNSPEANEGFDIEVFKVEEDENGIEELVPLMFDKPRQEIVNGILLDPDEQAAMYARAPLGPDAVDYFFDLSVDKEIDLNLDTLNFPSRGFAPSVYDRNPNAEEGCDDEV